MNGTCDTLQRNLFTPSVDAQYEAFHAAHPDVYRFFRDAARKLQASGIRHYGIAALFELVRWHYYMERMDDDFKINNNLKPIYARRLMEQEPELRGFFELRERKVA